MQSFCISPRFAAREEEIVINFKGLSKAFTQFTLRE